MQKFVGHKVKARTLSERAKAHREASKAGVSGSLGEAIRLEGESAREAAKATLTGKTITSTLSEAREKRVKQAEASGRLDAARQRIMTAVGIGVLPDQIEASLKASAAANKLTEGSINALIKQADEQTGFQGQDFDALADKAAEDIGINDAIVDAENEQAKREREQARAVSRATGLFRQVNGKNPNEEERAQIEEDPIRELAALQGGRRGQKVSKVQGQIGAMIATTGEAARTAELVASSLGLSKAFIARAASDPAGFQATINAMIAEDPDRMEAVVSSIEKLLADEKRKKEAASKKDDSAARLKGLIGATK